MTIGQVWLKAIARMRRRVVDRRRGRGGSRWRWRWLFEHVLPVGATRGVQERGGWKGIAEEIEIVHYTVGLLMMMVTADNVRYWCGHRRWGGNREDRRRRSIGQWQRTMMSFGRHRRGDARLLLLLKESGDTLIQTWTLIFIEIRCFRMIIVWIIRWFTIATAIRWIVRSGRGGRARAGLRGGTRGGRRRRAGWRRWWRTRCWRRRCTTTRFSSPPRTLLGRWTIMTVASSSMTRSMRRWRRRFVIITIAERPVRIERELFIRIVGWVMSSSIVTSRCWRGI